MNKPFTIYCLSQAMSPITHQQGVEGNESVTMRIEVMHRGRVVNVPALTGNMLRSVMLRQHGMTWLIKTLGLEKRLTRPEVYFLLAGGAEYSGGGRESTQLIASLAESCPLAGVLGGCAPSQIFAGSVNVSIGWLVCREAEDVINTYLPPGITLDKDYRFRPAAEFIGRFQYYRHDPADRVAGLYDEATDAVERNAAYESVDAKKRAPTPAEQPLDGEKADRDGGRKLLAMPYGGECIIPGSIYAHTIQVKHPTRLEAGAVLHSIGQWVDSGSRVGGMSGRDHGRLRTQLIYDPEYIGADQEYAEYVAGKADQITDWLMAMFRAKKEAKPKKGKAGVA